MLKSLLKFFIADDTENNSFYQVYQKIVKWKESNVFPNSYDLPEVITMPYDFWEKVKGLHRNTKADKLERSVSVYWVDGDLILSTITTGSTSFVRSNSQLKVSYIPRNNEYFFKEILLDGKRYSRKEIYYKKVPKQINLHYLFNMHTHPPHVNGENTYYGFFSAQDIKSLISSEAVVTGLITDNFYLLFRTNKVSISVENLEDRDLSSETITSKYSFVLYKGALGKKLYRVSSNLQSN